MSSPAFNAQVQTGGGVPSTPNAGWRPTQWSNGTPNTSITVTNVTTTVTGATTSDLGNAPGDQITTTTSPATTQQTTTIYYFDAVFSADHYTELELTRHPVQGGQSVVDHAYNLPAIVILEVQFSDTMQSFTQGQYASNASKSVSAYQTLESIRQKRVPVILTTHLQTYPVMILKSIRASDTNMTAYGAKMTLRFEQIQTGTTNSNTTGTTTNSARPDQSQTTPEGSVQPNSPVPAPITNTHTSGDGGLNSDPGPPQQFQIQTGISG